MRPVAEAFVVVAFGFEQLAEMGLAVDVTMQRSIVAETTNREGTLSWSITGLYYNTFVEV